MGRTNDKGLTAKQKMFCECYVIDFNGTKAAIQAGYNKKTAAVIASENLNKPNIQSYIKELQSKVEQKLEIDALWIAKRFKDISDRCIQAQPVLDSEGNETGEYRFDSAGANKATEMLGKHIGFFEKDNTLTIKGETPLFGDKE